MGGTKQFLGKGFRDEEECLGPEFFCNLLKAVGMIPVFVREKNVRDFVERDLEFFGIVEKRREISSSVE